MTQECKQPYTFVSVVTDNESIQLHDATFHDGKNNNDKLTGLIQCTLKVKTPMIVGHFQYKTESLKNKQIGNIQETVRPYGKPNNKGKRKEAKIIENSDDYIILPIGWEGCGFPQQDKSNEQKINYIAHKKKNILEPLFLEGTPESPVLIPGTSLKGMVRHAIGAISNSPMERVKDKQFSYRPGLVYRNQRDDSDYKLYEAKALEDLEEATNPEKTQTLDIKITDENYTSRSIEFTLDEELVKRYKLTTKTYENKKTPKKWKGARRRDKDYYSIKKGDTLYVEFTNDIVSFGNHEQYRWIYADTTTQIQDGTSGRHIPRRETHSPDNEKLNASSGKLTAVRSLFGFVDGGKDTKGDDLKLGIGEDTYSRLAGRISINTAVEVLTNDTELSERFIQQQNNFNIPLKILSGPKASAVECYIDQSTKPESGIFNTYGDFPGFEESGKPLSGRKFYWRWRQPKPEDYMLTPDNEQNEYKDSIALAGQQSAITRYISKPETKFKFTVRFKDMTEAELGALLTALSPQLHAESTEEYWQQIGHGRPLGLGSIQIAIDKIKTLQTSEEKTLKWINEMDFQKYIATFKASNLCNESTLKNWLTICKPVSGKRQYLTVKQHGDNRLSHIRKVRNADNRLTITKCFKDE